MKHNAFMMNLKLTHSIETVTTLYMYLFKSVQIKREFSFENLKA